MLDQHYSSVMDFGMLFSGRLDGIKHSQFEMTSKQQNRMRYDQVGLRRP